MTTITYIAAYGVLIDGLAVGGWCAEDSTTDISGNANTLTEVGTLTQSTTLTYGPTIQYSGFSTGNYLERAYDVDFELTDTTDGLLMMSWVNVGTVGDIDTVIDRGNASGTGIRYNLRINADGTVRGVVSDGTNTLTVDGSTTLTDLGWVHIGASWNGTDTLTLYVNGVQDASVTGLIPSATDAGTEKFRIGLSATGTDPCAQGISLTKLYPFRGTDVNMALIYDLEKYMFINGGQYMTVNQPTTLTFPTSELTRSGEAIRSVKTSIGGTKQVLFDREEVIWTVGTSELNGGDVTDVQLMLTSLIKGGEFNFDAYDTGNAINASMSSNKYSASRIETTDYFTYGFGVREE